MACVTFASLKLYYEKNQDNRRNIENLAALNKENQYFKDLNGAQAVRIQALTLTAAELRRVVPSIVADLKSLSIKPAQVNNYTAAGITTTQQIRTTLKDSIIFDTVRVSRIDYRDKWYNLEGTIRGDSVNLDIESWDRITVINYLGKRSRRFMFVRFGPRYPETVIKNENPNNRIIIEKSVFMKR